VGAYYCTRGPTPGLGVFGHHLLSFLTSPFGFCILVYADLSFYKERAYCGKKNLSMVFGALHDTKKKWKLCFGVFSMPPKGVKNREQNLFFFLLGGVRYTKSFLRSKLQKEKKIDRI
jgi:hypothetical protein